MKTYFQQIKHVFSPSDTVGICSKCEQPREYEMHYYPGPAPSERPVDVAMLCDAIENVSRGFVGLGDATANAMREQQKTIDALKSDVQCLVTEVLRLKANTSFELSEHSKRLDRNDNICQNLVRATESAKDVASMMKSRIEAIDNRQILQSHHHKIMDLEARLDSLSSAVSKSIDESREG